MLTYNLAVSVVLPCEVTISLFIRRETKPEPVVILLGWMGCQEKHLAKYSEFYVRKGCV